MCVTRFLSTRLVFASSSLSLFSSRQLSAPTSFFTTTHTIMGANLSKALGLLTVLVSTASPQLFLFSGKIFGNKEMRLLMLGLDAAGKTSEFEDDWIQV